MRTLLFLTLAVLFAHSSSGATARNVILVTVDGLRWQEVFRGADARLLADERFTPRDYATFEGHQAVGIAAARRQLMPFVWDVVATNGTLIGNRDQSSFMRVTNPWWFSYPGYNEILTGRSDPAIDSNDKRWNANVTVLEWLNGQRAFKGGVLVFGSWDAFAHIVNSQRSGIPVNIGPIAASSSTTAREQWLNELSRLIPKPWPTVRHDAFTHNYAVEAMRAHRPRVLYVAYGETDDFAHDGKYAAYLDATRRFDGFLRELWETAQSIPFYRNRTVLLVTTDHGRGEVPLETWQHHASARAVRGYVKSLAQYEQGIVGSDQIWFAALGPGIAARGVLTTQTEREQCQVAATLLHALGLSKDEFDSASCGALPDVFDSGT
jgi:hypothetical protein